MASGGTGQGSKRKPVRSASSPSEFRDMFVPILNEAHPAIRIAKPGLGKPASPVPDVETAIERFRKSLQGSAPR